MGLIVEAMEIYNAPVFDSDGQEALQSGVAHVPETSLPWSPTPRRNVYLAGHRMGYRGTWSRMVFYDLDKLGSGDEILLKDRGGKTCTYRVREVFEAGLVDSWTMGQVRGRDMVTLQTCTPIPTFNKRLIIRADRVKAIVGPVVIRGSGTLRATISYSSRVVVKLSSERTDAAIQSTRPPNFSLQIATKKRDDEVRLEPLTCSLRVRGRLFLGVAGVCKFPFLKPFCLPCLAQYCRTLRMG
jgi:LPXTG-site transpeptidase (sortase) family protein